MRTFAIIVLLVDSILFLAAVVANEAYRTFGYVVAALVMTVVNVIVLLWLLGQIHV